MLSLHLETAGRQDGSVTLTNMSFKCSKIGFSIELGNTKNLDKN